MLQEDWESDSKRVGHPSDTKTKLMDARECHGLAAFEAKPEGVDAIGYGMFFNSMFDLADSMVGRGQEGPLSKHGIAECTRYSLSVQVSLMDRHTLHIYWRCAILFSKIHKTVKETRITGILDPLASVYVSDFWVLLVGLTKTTLSLARV